MRDVDDAPARLPDCDRHPDAPVTVVRPARLDSLISPLRYACRTCGALLPGTVSETNRARFEKARMAENARITKAADDSESARRQPADLAGRLFQVEKSDPDPRSLAGRIAKLLGRG